MQIIRLSPSEKSKVTTNREIINRHKARLSRLKESRKVMIPLRARRIADLTDTIEQCEYIVRQAQRLHILARNGNDAAIARTFDGDYHHAANDLEYWANLYDLIESDLSFNKNRRRP